MRSKEWVDESYFNHFSVVGESSPLQFSSRVFVVHQGQDSGDGLWQCGKDKLSSDCTHIKRARDHLQKLIHGDPQAVDNAVHVPLEIQRDRKKYNFLLLILTL